MFSWGCNPIWQFNHGIKTSLSTHFTLSSQTAPWVDRYIWEATDNTSRNKKNIAASFLQLPYQTPSQIRITEAVRRHLTSQRLLASDRPTFSLWVQPGPGFWYNCTFCVSYFMWNTFVKIKGLVHKVCDEDWMVSYLWPDRKMRVWASAERTQSHSHRRAPTASRGDPLLAERCVCRLWGSVPSVDRILSVGWWRLPYPYFSASSQLTHLSMHVTYFMDPPK